MEATTAGRLAGAATVPRERVAALVMRYFLTSTAILLVAGLLGFLMRQSQADLARLEDNAFYAIMTAHGLGAFVAWAGFAVMGFGYWVLSSVDFEMRPLGYKLAEAVYWLMIAGTVGIIVTTLVFGFGGSWVFLYPLPFEASGRWSDATAGVFSFSVLLVGVAIIVWCVAILHTVVGPSLQSERKGTADRIAAAMGLGILWPRRFGADKVPYAVIPLTVIALDMIVATLPLAALLVAQVYQAFDSSFGVDPLLAKNALWFFGHPVVYLLLFPAVAIYYLLMPRYAGRDLIAGKAIAVAWLLGVIVNVIIWAHHVYLDYPEGTAQAAINVAMQPLTFSITVVSALSIYSLSATMWRSQFAWTPASKFLVAGLFGWLTAGLSGVVNATIALDVDVHNTLWIVGHFHHMAFLNIGLVIFAAAYAFVPEITGRRWYSSRLADWHLWMTVIGGYAAFVPWLIQGLTGAPRRFALLPEVWDPWTIAALPGVLVMGVGQLVFVWNLARTMRGFERPDDERSPLVDSRQLGLASVCAVCIAVPLFAVGIDRRDTGLGTDVQPAPTGPAQLFASSCGGCHVLEAAGTTGAVGPSLDELKPDQARVLKAIDQGGAGSGAMPADIISGEDARQVAAYVARSVGGGP